MQKPYPPPANPRPPPLPPPPKVWAPAVSAASWSFAYANEGVQVSTHLVADEAIVGVSTDGGELMIQGDHRVFMEEPDGSTFRLHHLVNSELEFTVDVSAIGCGCVGHVYLVEPHEKRDCGRSTGCVKVDLMKGNLQTLSTTLQSHEREGGGGNCGSNGCTYSVGSTPGDNPLFSDAGGSINLSSSVHVFASFDDDGLLSVALSQGGTSLQGFSAGYASNAQTGMRVAPQDVQRTRAALESGMIFEVAVRKSDEDCSLTAVQRCFLPRAVLLFRDLSIAQRRSPPPPPLPLPPPPSPSPSPSPPQFSPKPPPPPSPPPPNPEPLPDEDDRPGDDAWFRDTWQSPPPPPRSKHNRNPHAAALHPRPPAPPPPSPTLRPAPVEEEDYLDAISAAVLAAIAVVFLGFVCYNRKRSRTVAVVRRTRTRLSDQDSARANAPEVELVDEPRREELTVM
jgi:hypothetical protein